MSQSSSPDLTAITTLLQTYEKALNTADAPLAISLYTPDAIVMPQHQTSRIGIDAISKAYNGFFENIKFDVKFDIQEVVPTAPDWAFARTNSAGTTDVKGRGVGREANQELFVMQKVKGEWKIARYCFSTTNPPPGK